MTSAGVQGGTTTVSYNPDGTPQKATEPTGQTLSWSFNPDNTLHSLVAATSGGSTLSNWTYTYDGDYRQTSQAFSGASGSGGSLVSGTSTYGYDGASRLTSYQPSSGPAQTISWNHNGDRLTAGGAPQQQFTYNADDSIATWANGAGQSYTYQYGISGQLLSDGCATYGYDGFNRLTVLTPVVASGCPTQTVTTSTYDGLGRVSRSGSATIHYDGLGGSVAAENTPSGTTNVYELGASGQALGVTAELSSPTTQYLVDDGQGNVSTAISSAQAVACSARFDPFGNPLGAQGASNPCNTGSTYNDLFYRGARLDTATGDYTFGARTYAPTKSAFLTPDTYQAAPSSADLSVGTDPLTLNRYTYVNGDPVNLVDPSGHMACADRDCTYGAWHGRAMGDPNKAKRIEAREAAYYAYEGALAATSVATGRQAAREDAQALNECGGFDACYAHYMSDNYPIHFDGGAFVSAVVSVLAAVVVTGACEAASAGTGSVGCAMLGGAAGGLTNGLLTCNGDAGCIGKNTLFGTLGGAGGAVLGKVMSGLADEFSPALAKMFGSRPAVGGATEGSGVPSAFDFKLDPADIGASRSVHFNRANAALDQALQANPDLAAQLEETSPGIQTRVAAADGRENPLNYVWHHATIGQAGEEGWLYLVPKAMHTPGSDWWALLHPGGFGGYSEWAVPAGAPPN